MGIMSFFLIYIIVLVAQMQSGDIDQIKNTVMSNPLGEEGGRNDLQYGKFNFLPLIEIYNQSPWQDQDHLDIWDGDPSDRIFDLEKYYNYVTAVSIQRNRNFEQGYYVYSQNMRSCTPEDFTSRGYKPDEGMLYKISRHRFLCYDVDNDDIGTYGLLNFYNAATRFNHQLNVHQCIEADRDCKDPDLVREMVTHHIWNVFILQQRAELGREDSTDMLKT